MSVILVNIPLFLFLCYLKLRKECNLLEMSIG